MLKKTNKFNISRCKLLVVFCEQCLILQASGDQIEGFAVSRHHPQLRETLDYAEGQQAATRKHFAWILSLSDLEKYNALIRCLFVK